MRKMSRSFILEKYDQAKSKNMCIKKKSVYCRITEVKKNICFTREK